MPCNYLYLQANLYKRFGGAVSKTALLKKIDKKLRVRAPVKYFFCFRKDAEFFV